MYEKRMGKCGQVYFPEMSLKKAWENRHGSAGSFHKLYQQCDQLTSVSSPSKEWSTVNNLINGNPSKDCPKFNSLTNDRQQYPKKDNHMNDSPIKAISWTFSLSRKNNSSQNVKPILENACP